MFKLFSIPNVFVDSYYLYNFSFDSLFILTSFLLSVKALSKVFDNFLSVPELSSTV